MLRRHFLVFACSALLTSTALTSTTLGQSGNVREPTLGELLENGLRATRAEEKAYIGRIVKLVNKGVLKESLVKAVFQRARQRNTEHPFPYFKAMLEAIQGKLPDNLSTDVGPSTTP